MKWDDGRLRPCRIVGENKSASRTRSCTLAGIEFVSVDEYRHNLSFNELGLAFDVLAEVGAIQRANIAFWHALRSAAFEMNLTVDAGPHTASDSTINKWINKPDLYPLPVLWIFGVRRGPRLACHLPRVRMGGRSVAAPVHGNGGSQCSADRVPASNSAATCFQWYVGRGRRALVCPRAHLKATRSEPRHDRAASSRRRLRQDVLRRQHRLLLPARCVGLIGRSGPLVAVSHPCHGTGRKRRDSPALDGRSGSNPGSSEGLIDTRQDGPARIGRT